VVSISAIRRSTRREWTARKRSSFELKFE